MVSTYKKGLRNYKPVSLTLMPKKVMHQFLSACIQDNQVTRLKQHGFMKSRFCFTKLISFCDKVTHIVDEGKAVDVAYLYFNKALNIVFHSILPENLAAHGHTLLWVRNFLSGW